MTLDTFLPHDDPRRTTTAPTFEREPVARVDDDGRYVIGRAGVAWYVVGRSQRWVPDHYLAPCDAHDADPAGAEDCDVCAWYEDGGEWVDDPAGQLWACMVGDDTLHPVDADELEPIAEDDYCGGCGQVGCAW